MNLRPAAAMATRHPSSLSATTANPIVLGKPYSLNRSVMSHAKSTLEMLVFAIRMITPPSANSTARTLRLPERRVLAIREGA